jgi:hypothetical protein
LADFPGKKFYARLGLSELRTFWQAIPCRQVTAPNRKEGFIFEVFVNIP